jgi:hypothetical protein
VVIYYNDLDQLLIFAYMNFYIDSIFN